LYYQAKRTLGSENLRLLKLLIFGPPGAGKSSLLKVLLGNNPDLEQNSTGVCDINLVQCTIAALITSDPVYKSTWTKVELKHEISRLKHIIDKKLDSVAAVESIVSQNVHDTSQDSQNVPLQIETKHFFNADAKCIEEDSPIFTQTSSLIACYDCGGQLEFFDVMPALMTIPTGYVMVFDMSKDLNSHTSMYHSDNAKLELQNNTSTKDLMKTALANVQSCTTSVSNVTITSRLPTRGKLVVVGTHLDKLEEKYHKVSHIDKEITKLFPGSIEKIINVQVRSDKNIKIVHPISNITEEGRDDIAQEIRTAIEHMAEKVTADVPISWLLFQLEVRLKGIEKGYVLLKECVEVAKHCYIEESDVNSVIGYFHELGILLNYPKLEGVVFCDHQWLFDKLTKLIKLKFVPIFGIDSGIKKGVLKEEALCQLYAEDFTSDDILNYRNLLQLFESLSIIAKLPDETGRYFVPALLNPAPTDSIEKSPNFIGSKIYDTLIVKFANRYLPRGVFCCLVATLMKSETGLRVQYNENVYKDLLIFQISTNQQYLLLRDNVQSIAVEMYSTGNGSLQEPVFICSILYKALTKVCNDIHLTSDFKFGFACNQCNRFAGVEDHIPFLARSSCESCEFAEELSENQVIWFISIDFLIRKVY